MKNAKDGTQKVLVLDVYGADGYDAPDALVAFMDAALVERIAQLSKIVAEHSLSSVTEFNGSAVWAMEAGEVFEFREMIGGGDGSIAEGGEKIREVKADIAKRLSAEFRGPVVSELRCRTDVEEMVVTDTSVYWTACPKGASETYQSQSVGIADLCERFGVALPPHVAEIRRKIALLNATESEEPAASNTPRP